MSFNMNVFAGLPTALTHALTFLTTPLLMVYPATTVLKLQLILQGNILSHYMPAFSLTKPSKTTACPYDIRLLLAPNQLPPTPILAACIAMGIDWPTWATLLGGEALEIIITEDCFAFRAAGKLTIVWQASVGIAKRHTVAARQAVAAKPNDIRMPTVTAISSAADVDAMEMDVDTMAVSISRPSSRSSTTSSHASLSSFASSGNESATSAGSEHAPCMSDEDMPYSPPKAAPRARSPSVAAMDVEDQPYRPGPRRVVVDKTRQPQAYKYQGGETTVLTGGVMLGRPSKALPKLASSPRLPSAPSTRPSPRPASTPAPKQSSKPVSDGPWRPSWRSGARKMSRLIAPESDNWRSRA
ncbi:uncharacterized protein SCHCODRAFT_02628872 [Schizophyllum commune H4-8]|uniref:uncharacterized protein n=1 Tax=Schizophyllum commune (strain H4-8 / FGSC 9210) TaxID=578458 RepID=UPI00215DF6B5|nr:uncharacterized protein SCHCODRAFT_02628872 [Schizophyllum commune H4-8]KAI5891353.1 hypothetical protein SCHCODRAFT_02628872 [Schizophyllum commune H4-8]